MQEDTVTTARVIQGGDGGRAGGGRAGGAWRVPGYTELRPLGSGGFGEVVLARHDGSGTLVAVKYLRAELLADAGFAAMFRGEAAVLGSLADPHVVRLYEYVEGPAGAAIVMELVDGVSLRQVLAAQGATSPQAALVVLQGSLLGLAAAHAAGVVHRDYKPENVLIGGDGASKLTDFGIAARAGDRARPAGTLAYAPPEQFAGAPASPAADVYAATATFYECLTGRPPFTGDTAAALRAQHRTAPVPLAPVPAPLRPLVTAGMAKHPADRPVDGTTLVTALRAAAAGAYGPDWEHHGRTHLAEAALLLAALWPTARPPATTGTTTDRIPLYRRTGTIKAAIATAVVIAGAVAGTALAATLASNTQHHLTPVKSVSLQPSPPPSGSSAPLSPSSPTSSAPSVPSSASTPSSPPTSPSSPPPSSPSSPSSPPPSSPSHPSLPVVTGISPASGTTAGGTTVTITGTALAGATKVSFGGTSATIKADSGTQISVITPAGTGTVTITVTTPAGTSTAGTFTYVTPAPTVTSVSPDSGTTAGGTTVTITGTNLAGATGVSFGGAAAKMTADSGTQITVISPAGSGTVTITVTTPGGTAAGQFTYVTPPPSVTSVSPTSGPTGGGTTVDIYGTNLAGATSVSFGGAAAKITSDSGTEIVVTSPAGSGSVNITVTTPGGTSAITDADQFTYYVLIQ